jgi:hypothetical protein
MSRWSSRSRTPDSHSGGHGFESHTRYSFLCSSTVERPAVNRTVLGSNPSGGASKYMVLYVSLCEIDAMASTFSTAQEPGVLYTEGTPGQELPDYLREKVGNWTIPAKANRTYYVSFRNYYPEDGTNYLASQIQITRVQNV